MPLATVAVLTAYALLILLLVRALSIGLRAGYHPVHGRVAWQAWATERLMSMARVGLFPLYASLFTPVWLRALGMRVGRRVEASTVLALPSMTTVGDGAFLADDTMVASYELGGGWLRLGAARVGKRAFLGNSGMTAPGRAVPNRGLVGVLSATPKKAKAGSSYLGMPPMKLPRAVERGDQSRTFDPPKRLMLARAAVELCRVIPVMATVALAVATLGAFEALATEAGFAVALAAGGAVLLAAGVVACLVTAAAKWLLVGAFRVGERPLWSSFVWRNELADTFVEVLAVPWLAGAVGGTPLMSLWLRGLGARIGRGVWCETYWLPETDLIRIGDGATVNRGCVVQTHLFHDRIMRMDQVTLGEGATLGPHGIVLPGAAVGAHATVGPASLVMRGETVPGAGRWLGNPIAAWPADSRPGTSDPYLPRNGNVGYRDDALRPGARLPGGSRPALRPGDDRGVGRPRPRGAQPGPRHVAGRAGPGRRRGGPLQPSRRQAARPAGQAAARGEAVHGHGAIRRRAATDPQPVGRPRLGTAR